MPRRKTETATAIGYFVKYNPKCYKMVKKPREQAKWNAVSISTTNASKLIKTKRIILTGGAQMASLTASFDVNSESW